ncbi:hypothetical protein AAG906_028067 [Vitis piasezkii]
MHSEFKMSMMGELKFFLGLQIKQLKEGTFINQAKYIKNLLKRFNMEETKTMKTLMSSSIKLDMDEKETGTSRAQGKRHAEPSLPKQTEARQKARYDMTLFSSVDDYQRYKQKFAQRKVVLGRSINLSQLQHFGFEGLFSGMGWDGYQL